MNNIKETDEYIVVEFTNDSGKKYRVGYPKASGYSKENIAAEIAATNEDPRAKAATGTKYVELEWIPNGESKTSRAAINIGIVGGYVNQDTGVIYECQVNFSNSARWSFLFQDNTKDTYSCSTPRNGNHYIDYNSDDPKMIGVK